MEDLYNVIIFFDKMSNYSILRHFIKVKRKCFFPKIFNKLNNKYDESTYKIKKPSICYPYNKEVFNYNIFELKYSKEKLIKQNIITRDGIIIILQNINSIKSKLKKYLFDIIENNYGKPILILFNTTEYKQENKYISKKRKRKSIDDYRDIHNFEEELKRMFVRKVIKIDHYFPIISIIKDTKNDIVYLNIKEKYEKNPIQIFVEQLQHKKIKTFSINSENYPEKNLLKEFEKGTLPIRIWNHYTKLRIIFLYLNTYGIEQLVSEDSILCEKWNKYLKNIKQEFTWNYNSLLKWCDILNNLIKSNNLKKNKYKDFENLYLRNSKIHVPSYFKIFI